jgi:NhaA family Na+:H+ antiporter
LKNFFKSEPAIGIVMIISALLAIIMANSPASEYYHNLINLKFETSYFAISLQHFVQDVLMVAFFFLIGLELKKEMREGFLTKKDQIFLPLIAACGGMLVPSLIYLFFTHNHAEAAQGWAIPAATDIAFAVCILTLVAPQIKPSVKIFLLAIAIFDDLGAIIIIAVFYSKSVQIMPLFLSLLVILIMFGLNKFNAKNPWYYIIGGLILLPLFHQAGIHTTIAGVITAFLVPMYEVKNLAHKIHLPINFIVLPLFAFVSSGIYLMNLSMDMLLSPVTLGVALGLFIGKQIGIFGVTYAAVKLNWASKPGGATWIDIYGVSILAGIGFTMSLFVTALAFNSEILREEAKLGVILGSTLSIILGAVIFKINLQHKII